MPRPRPLCAFRFVACAALSASVLLAQTPPPSPSTALAKARALYYTPADAGLQSLHCEIAFNWKNFLQKVINEPVPDGDARLQYLRTIQLSIDDDLHGAGDLHWIAPAPPPEGTEDSIGKVRGGFQQMWQGFFQSWNSFVTGDLFTVDPNSIVERNADGYHVTAKSATGMAEEQFDGKLLLTSLHIASPTLDSVVKPVFTPSPQGLLVTTIRSVYKQPPTAPSTDLLMTLGYTTVGNFQIPSGLTVSVGPATFDFRLANCTVKTK